MTMLSSAHRSPRSPSFPRGPAGGSRQAGVGLIEVMIAVLILSIGFLGVGALLSMSLSTNNSAMARSLATMDSYTIFDAMRADIANAKSGLYNGNWTQGNCPVVATGNTLAQNQLGKWCNQLLTDLGAANTSGNIACTNTGDCTVTIQFDDSRAGVSGAKQQKVTTEAIL